MTFSSFLEILMLLVPIELIFGIALGIYFYSYLKLPYKELTFYLAICLITDLLSRIAGDLLGSNLVFFIIFSIFELLFFYFFYQKHFSYNKKRLLMNAFVYLAVAYMLGELYYLLNTKPKEFQTYSRSLSSFVILVIIFDYLFKLLKSNNLKSNQLKQCSILIVYCSINLIFFLPFNFLINVHSSVKFYFWFFNLITTVVFYSLIIKEIWKNGSKQKLLQRG